MPQQKGVYFEYMIQIQRLRKQKKVFISPYSDEYALKYNSIWRRVGLRDLATPRDSKVASDVECPSRGAIVEHSLARCMVANETNECGEFDAVRVAPHNSYRPITHGLVSLSDVERSLGRFGSITGDRQFSPRDGS